MANSLHPVYFVGAGPGDPELITIKAVNAIKNADIILYDKLVNDKILDYARPDVELMYVGKECGKHYLKQDELNELILSKAKSGARVLRLKGGDPFVFGRGGEEALFLQAHGITFEFVPGVSSSISAPQYAGIPVTHRGTSAYFTVITGHEAPDKESLVDWKCFGGRGTLVFLMGVKSRASIAQNLIEVGRPTSEPVAFIENGTTDDQSVVITTLGELAESEVLVRSPAVMVVGQVVHLRNELKWFGNEIKAWQSDSEAFRQIDSLVQPSL